MSADTPAPRELAAQLADTARALKDRLPAAAHPDEAFTVLADLIATQGLLTQLYEEFAARHRVGAASAPVNTITAERLDAAAQRSDLTGLWLDSALRSCAEATAGADRTAA